MYAALPIEYDIHSCMLTQGYICMVHQALYPPECIEWCIWALHSRLWPH